MKNFHTKNNKGYTLIEMMISIGILTAIMAAVAVFQTDIFSLNDYIDRGIRDQAEAKNLIKHFVREVRSASESEQGAYPIRQADADTFVFYSDIDFDSIKEEVRYFIEEGILKKAVVEPSGDPLTYDGGDESVINVVVNVINEQPFKYFDENYTGSTTDFLVEPFMVSQIRMVGIDLVIDSDPDNPPESFEIGTQVNIRNLRDR